MMSLKGKNPMKLNRRVFLGTTLAATALAATSAQAAEITLRIHTLVKSPHPYNDMAAFLKSELEEKSGGRLKVRIFDAGQLGEDPAVIGEVGLGTIDMMISSVSNAVQQIPELGIFGMPYLFANIDELAKKVGPDTDVQQHFAKAFADRGVGMKLLALGGSGTRNLASTSVVVNGIDDLAGLKMRTPPAPMDSLTWAALGMLPVTVAWGELYSAMQTGLADAMESSLPGYTGSKLYEVAPNLALTGHTIQVNHTSISERTWNKLPEDLQALVQKTTIAANQHGIEQAKKYDGDLVQKLQADHGVNVTRPDKAPFIAKLKPAQADMAEQLNLTREYAILT
jgi:TRAP-type transport system periplasmic protein